MVHRVKVLTSQKKGGKLNGQIQEEEEEEEEQEEKDA